MWGGKPDKRCFKEWRKRCDERWCNLPRMMLSDSDRLFKLRRAKHTLANSTFKKHRPVVFWVSELGSQKIATKFTEHFVPQPLALCVRVAWHLAQLGASPQVGPTYVCLTFGTFVCTTCGGLHREFSHKVKARTGRLSDKRFLVLYLFSHWKKTMSTFFFDPKKKRCLWPIFGFLRWFNKNNSDAPPSFRSGRSRASRSPSGRSKKSRTWNVTWSVWRRGTNSGGNRPFFYKTDVDHRFWDKDMPTDPPILETFSCFFSNKHEEKWPERQSWVLELKNKTKFE